MGMMFRVELWDEEMKSSFHLCRVLGEEEDVGRARIRLSTGKVSQSPNTVSGFCKGLFLTLPRHATSTPRGYLVGFGTCCNFSMLT
jgi:hypothetical protein